MGELQHHTQSWQQQTYHTRFTNSLFIYQSKGVNTKLSYLHYAYI